MGTISLTRRVGLRDAEVEAMIVEGQVAGSRAWGKDDDQMM